MLVFGERGKPEYPEKNLSEQSREPTNIYVSYNEQRKLQMQNYRKNTQTKRLIKWYRREVNHW